MLTTYWYASAGVGISLRWIAALAPLFLVSSIAFSIWAFAGLETALFTALVGATFAADARGRIGVATVAMVLASLTRPEGALLAVTVLPFRWIRSSKSEKPFVVACGAAYAAAILALTLFRVLYYGSPLPNTFYAKVGGVPWTFGLRYLHDFLLSGVLPLMIPAAWAAANDRVSRVGASWAAIMAAYIVYVGGDAFSGHRFWLPVLPVIAALSVRAIVVQRARRAGDRREVLFWTCLIASAVWTLLAPGAGMILLVGLALAAVGGYWGRSSRWAVVFLLFLVATVVVYEPSDPQAKFAKTLVRRQYVNLARSVRPRYNTTHKELRFRYFFEGQTEGNVAKILAAPQARAY